MTEKSKSITINLENDQIVRFLKKEFIFSMTLEIYQELISIYGLEKVWNSIVKSIISSDIKIPDDSIFEFDALGELYEIGLAHANKISKKEMGKYFTPIDVSTLMAEILLEGGIQNNLVDVACGTGNLIIETLRKMIASGIDVDQFIKRRKLWLYDIDSIAIKVTLLKIRLLLGYDYSKYINVVCGDFLNRNIKLPYECSVITNPPYSKISKMDDSWDNDEIIEQSRDLYAGFMSKIANFANKAVIVSPQSYLVSEKFEKLREKLSMNFFGEIYSFDNVPGTLFNGKKHGVFNTNNSNGVRGAISCLRRNGHNGFRLTHLIRFKSKQRSQVLNIAFLKSKLGDRVQDLMEPIKSFRELEPLVDHVMTNPHIRLSALMCNQKEYIPTYYINVSSSARYFVVASSRELDRDGSFVIYPKDYDSFILLYALLNSSYVYMWWRFFDGGILFAKRHILNTPLPVNVLKGIERIEPIVKEMILSESKYLSYKKNAGKVQESIKFPIAYRDQLNQILFNEYSEYFELLHNNFEVEIYG